MSIPVAPVNNPAGETYVREYTFVAPNPDESVWAVDERRPYYRIFDFGIAKATGGNFKAQLLAYDKRHTASQIWLTQNATFHFLFLYSGKISIRLRNGTSINLEQHDSIMIPPGMEYCEMDLSSDFRAFEIVALLGGQVGFAELMDPSISAPVISREKDAVYTSGLRKFFTYRDLGVMQATNGKMNFHLIRAKPDAGGDLSTHCTGWHYHTAGQFGFGLGGSCDCEMDGHGVMRIVKDTANTLWPGLRHNAYAVSADYALVECVFPGKYETIAVEGPTQRSTQMIDPRVSAAAAVAS